MSYSIIITICKLILMKLSSSKKKWVSRLWHFWRQNLNSFHEGGGGGGGGAHPRTSYSSGARVIGKRSLFFLDPRLPPQYQNIFLCNNCNATDMQLIPLELVESNRDSVHKAREAYLIETGQTLEPLGLNKKDETALRSLCKHFC